MLDVKSFNYVKLWTTHYMYSYLDYTRNYKQSSHEKIEEYEDFILIALHRMQ